MVDNIGCNLDRYSPKDFESNKRVSLSPDSEPFRNSHGYIGVSNGSNNSNTDMAEITRDETNFCTELARNHPSPNKPRLEEKLGLRSLVARLSSSFEIHLQVHVVQNLCVEVDRLKSEAENHLRTLGTIVTESNYRVILDMFHKNLQISRLAFNENLLITGVLTNSISPTDKDIEDCYDNYVQSIAEYVIHCIWKENPCLPWRLDKYPAFQGKIKRHLIDSLLRDMDYTTFKEDIKFFNRMKWANINIPVDFSQYFCQAMSSFIYEKYLICSRFSDLNYGALEFEFKEPTDIRNSRENANALFAKLDKIQELLAQRRRNE